MWPIRGLDQGCLYGVFLQRANYSRGVCNGSNRSDDSFRLTLVVRALSVWDPKVWAYPRIQNLNGDGFKVLQNSMPSRVLAVSFID